MIPNLRNNQDHLAEEYRRTESYLAQESRIALLKIQSWQFAMKTPEVGLHYQQEAAAMVKQSLLCFVPNSFVLSEEGYYFSAINN
jgi:predicted transcriptional regulator